MPVAGLCPLLFLIAWLHECIQFRLSTSFAIHLFPFARKAQWLFEFEDSFRWSEFFTFTLFISLFSDITKDFLVLNRWLIVAFRLAFKMTGGMRAKCSLRETQQELIPKKGSRLNIRDGLQLIDNFRSFWLCHLMYGFLFSYQCVVDWWMAERQQIRFHFLLFVFWVLWANQFKYN